MVGNFPGWGRDGNAGWACKEGAASGAVTGAGASSGAAAVVVVVVDGEVKVDGSKDSGTGVGFVFVG